MRIRTCFVASFLTVYACSSEDDPFDAGVNTDAGLADTGVDTGCNFTDWAITEDRVVPIDCSPYEVDGSITVSGGATLTINAGVEMRFSDGEWLEVGEDSGGRLVVDGSAAAPVVFTSRNAATAQAGAWHGLFLRAQTLSGSRITYATVRFAGRSGFGVRGAITVDSIADGALALENVRVEDAEQSGIAATGGTLSAITGIEFEDCAAGLRFAPDRVGDVAEAFTYENTPVNTLEIGAVTETATWVAQGVPWVSQGSVNIEGPSSPMLTLEEGVHLQFDEGEWLEVGETEAGGLVVAGSTIAPVVFESARAQPQPGDWHGIFLRSNTLPNTQVDRAIVRHGGRSGFGVRGCITLVAVAPSAVTITNSTFASCEQSGVATGQTANQWFAGFSDNTFVDSDAGVWLHANVVGSVQGPQTYMNTAENLIVGGALDRTQTWGAQPVPWRMTGSTLVEGANNPVLTIEGGATVQFDEGEWLEVGETLGGGLMVDGSSTAWAIFESDSATPAAGDWHGLVLRGQTLLGSSLDWAWVRHGGRSGFGVTGCVTVESGAPGAISVTNSRFEDCAQAGVSAELDGFTFDTFVNNGFVRSEAGLWLNVQTVGSIDGVQSYQDTPVNRIRGGTVVQSASWLAQGVPYRLDDDIEVEGVNSPVLTLLAALILEFGDGSWLNVGEGAGGGLMVMGTVNAPVIMRSENAVPSSGDWFGIFLRGQTLPGTSIDNLELQHAGRAGFGVRGGLTLLDTGNTVSISNSEFSNNANADVWIDCDSTPTLSANTYAVGAINETPCP